MADPVSRSRAGRRLRAWAGRAWAWPLTLPMQVVAVCARPFGARIAHRGAIWVVTRFPFGPKGALALGTVVISPLPSLDVRVPSYRARALRGIEPDAPLARERVHLGRHELAHVRQSLVLGPLFPIAYLLCGGVHARNPFERAADRYARTGRGWWPGS